MMRKKLLQLKLVAIAIGTVLLVTSCASVVNGTYQEQSFQTIPRGATVKIDGEYFGHTPLHTTLRRKDEHLVEINLPGYRPAKFKMEQHISGWYFGNLLIGGIVGLIVDYADGAIYTLEPSMIHDMRNGHYKYLDRNTITVVLSKNIPSRYRLQKVGQLKRA